MILNHVEQHNEISSLYRIMNELRGHINTNKDIFFKQCLSSRLDKCLAEYYHKLNISFDKVDSYNYKNNLGLMKKINKEF